MKNRYETVFIMTPVLSEEQMKETVQKFREFITNRGGEFKHEEDWGLRKLAYPIQKKSTGFYQLFEYEAEGELIAPMETEFIRDERILRFLTVKLNKYAVAYVEKKRSAKTAQAETSES